MHLISITFIKGKDPFIPLKVTSTLHATYSTPQLM